MAISSLLRVLRRGATPRSEPYQANTSKLASRLLDVFLRTWDLGFTAFGGPNVHFQIWHRRFVDHPIPWIDEQTYQELFAICQALPGPGSTKMLFCIVLLHAGLIPALGVFLMWALPGAIGMYLLSLGVRHINEVLPSIVYAFLSGLNSATVGIFALAGVQLAGRAITDPLSRLLVILGACAGLCYNALWYFPILLVIGGIVTMFWDSFGRGLYGRWKEKRGKKTGENEDAKRTENVDMERLPDTDNDLSSGKMEDTAGGNSTSTRSDHTSAIGDSNITIQQRRQLPPRDSNSIHSLHPPSPDDAQVNVPSASEAPAAIMQREEKEKENESWDHSGGPDMLTHAISIRLGIAIIILFFISFIAILVARGVVNKPPLELDLFANMYLAGTIIFGGGPVVIPLLREYVVQPGWASSRDFLLGLAIIQAFPGPNFNFAVYLGGLTLSPYSPYNTHHTPALIGSLLGFLGIFFPGMTLAVGFQAIWRSLRSKPYVIALLRGINATAVGLVFTAVYRLWEIGYLSKQVSTGSSLGKEPWWVVVAAVAFCGGRWFGVPAPVGIVLGGVAGLVWYGAVEA